MGSYKEILFNPIFIFGLFAKIVLIFTLVDSSVEQFYPKHLDYKVNDFLSANWRMLLTNQSLNHVLHDNIVWIFFLPLSLAAKIFSIQDDFAYQITILFFDVLVLLMISKLVPEKLTKRIDRILIFYWISPILIFCNYLISMTAIVPLAFLLISIFCVKSLNIKLSGFFLTLAIATETAMIITLPVFVIFFLNNAKYFHFVKQFFVSFLISSGIVIISLIYENNNFFAFESNYDFLNVISYQFPLNSTLSIFITPMIYFIGIYAVWRMKKFNLKMFLTFICLGFLLISLILVGSPKWILWSLPFIVIFQVQNGRNTALLFYVFFALYCLSLKDLVLFAGKFQAIQSYIFQSNLQIQLFQNIIFTLCVTLGVIIMYILSKQNIFNNDFFLVTRKPLVIGISGDSGSGKDSLVNSIIDLFGSHSVSHVSGDNYHNWDRQKLIWEQMTHLNPISNNLEKFKQDIFALIAGKDIINREYNHKTGKLSRPKKLLSKDIIISSGLHSLYEPSLRSKYDLSIFLNTDEEVRKSFKFNRDLLERGHTKESIKKSFNDRKKDSIQFIKPQINFADLVFSIKPLKSSYKFEKEKEKPKLKLLLTTDIGDLNQGSLNKFLISIFGMKIVVTEDYEDQKVNIMYEGEIEVEEIELAAKKLFPYIFQHLDIYPKWHGDVKGLIQLITLSQIDQCLRKKII